MSRKLRLDLLLNDDEVDRIAATLGEETEDVTDDMLLDWMTKEIQSSIDDIEILVDERG